MGKWKCYTVTFGPGERDSGEVAAELRAVVPDCLRTCLGERTVEYLLDDRQPPVWTEDGLVHWTTGRSFKPVYELRGEFVPQLDVHTEWACAVWQHEVDYVGSVEVFGWVDGEFVRRRTR